MEEPSEIPEMEKLTEITQARMERTEYNTGKSRILDTNPPAHGMTYPVIFNFGQEHHQPTRAWDDPCNLPCHRPRPCRIERSVLVLCYSIVKVHALVQLSPSA
jgi:hypothetical protein